MTRSSATPARVEADQAVGWRRAVPAGTAERLALVAVRYYVDSVEKTLSVGVYPEVSLKRARERRHEIRSQVANGSNPSDDRKAQRRGREQTFELVAREWWEKRRHLWKDEYANVRRSWIGNDPDSGC